jgi:hypothetical protein
MRMPAWHYKRLVIIDCGNLFCVNWSDIKAFFLFHLSTLNVFVSIVSIEVLEPILKHTTRSRFEQSSAIYFASLPGEFFHFSYFSDIDYQNAHDSRYIYSNIRQVLDHSSIEIAR